MTKDFVFLFIPIKWIIGHTPNLLSLHSLFFFCHLSPPLTYKRLSLCSVTFFFTDKRIHQRGKLNFYFSGILITATERVLALVGFFFFHFWHKFGFWTDHQHHGQRTGQTWCRTIFTNMATFRPRWYTNYRNF